MSLMYSGEDKNEYLNWAQLWQMIALMEIPCKGRGLIDYTFMGGTM